MLASAGPVHRNREQRGPGKAVRFPHKTEDCAILPRLSARLGLRQGQARWWFSSVGTHLIKHLRCSVLVAQTEIGRE